MCSFKENGQGGWVKQVGMVVPVEPVPGGREEAALWRLESCPDGMGRSPQASGPAPSRQPGASRDPIPFQDQRKERSPELACCPETGDLSV